MPRERLRETVSELERELDSLHSIDPETRVLLESVVGELQEVLQSDSPGEKTESLSERITHAAQDFETSHPTLGGILSRVIDLLGQIGI